jgi:ABC-type nitrate/sulfonate/bicarbonate transport system substrate-binding protein
MRYVFAKHKDENRELLNSNAFKTYKKQFDVDAMKKSWENIEQHYKNIFFKSFWRPERVERFTKALNESYEIASKNIEISDELLSKAMLEAIE